MTVLFTTFFAETRLAMLSLPPVTAQARRGKPRLY
jgi:hypothetical protein